MPRIEEAAPYRGYRGPSFVREEFTHRAVLADGTVVWWDGRDFWRVRGFSWYGEPPAGWDASLAVPHNKVFSYSHDPEFDP